MSICPTIRHERK